MLDFQRKQINPTRDELKEGLDIALGRVEVQEEKKLNLLEYIDLFIQTTIQDNEVSRATIEKYKILKKRLQEYGEKHGTELPFEEIDEVFYKKFRNLIFADKKVKSKNTVDTYIKFLKKVMKVALKDDVHNNHKFKDFKRINHDVENIYLSQKEVDTLAALELSQNIRLERVRDYFVIGCETGLRFSDFIAIRKEFISSLEDGTVVLNIRQMKTDEQVVIPLKPSVIKILEKYDYELPRAISNQKMNKYLKELGELAGITERVTMTKLGELITTEKYNLISTHTARRSFATKAYLAGVPPMVVMKITGHRTESIFLKYIKVSKLENAMQAAKHPFFRGTVGDSKSNLRKVS